jgi:hypothetical protein
MSFSIDVAWDVGTDYDGDGDSFTDEINKFEANIGSWIKQSITDPTSFTEVGVFKIDTLYPTDGSFEDFTGGAGSTYSITGILPQISGVVTDYGSFGQSWMLEYSIISNNDPGGDLQLYLQDGHIAGDAAEDMVTYYNDGGTFGSFAGAIDEYDDGTLFAAMNFESNLGYIYFDRDIFGGDGANAEITGGTFNADFSFVPGNGDWYWNDENFAYWEALGYAFFAELTSTLASNTGNSFIAGPDGVGNIDILGDLQDGTTFSAVPEPTTLLLFGTGILGLAALGRKRRNHK